MTKIKGPSGAVIDVSPHQARGLVRDGFASYVDEEAKKEGEVLPRRAQGESESAQFAVGRVPKHIQQAAAKVKATEAEPEPPEAPAAPGSEEHKGAGAPQTPDGSTERPAGNQSEAPQEGAPSARASRDELVEHAVKHGVVKDEEELQGKTKADIRELIEGSN